MKKIGIVTFYQSTSNYGQVLQCFALQRLLRNRGFDPETIRCALSVPKASSRARGITPYKVMRKISSLPQEARVKRAKRMAAQADTPRCFQEFREEYLSMSIEYPSVTELEHSELPYEALICGSDQIWGSRPDIDWGRLSYLSFGSDSVPRIAYAASFGRMIPSTEWQDYLEIMSGFCAIGIREEEGVRLMRDMGINNAKLVLDPTLLLNIDEYPQEYEGNGEYILSYIVNVRSPDFVAWDEIKAYADYKRIVLRLVLATGFLSWTDIALDSPSEMPTVPQWVGLIRNASMIVTSSYHGVLFSILAHREFLAFCLPDETRGNERIISILSKLGLLDRIYNPYIPFSTQMNRPIDWSVVDQRLNELRDYSLSFLFDALG